MGRSTNNTIYVWKGEEEGWELEEGHLLEGRGIAGGSLVPVSSGILDYCQEYEPLTDRPYKEREVQPESWKSIHDIWETE